MVWALAFGIGMILTLPTPFPLPMLSLMVSLEFMLSLTFSLRFFQICVAPNSHRYWDACDFWKNFYDLTFWMTSLVLSWDYEELLWDQGGEDNACPRDVSDGNLGVDWLALEEDLKMPTFLRVMTSSVVYSSTSLATPWNSVSLLAKGPTGHEWSLLSCLGVTVWCGMVTRNDNLWKEVLGELHASRNEKAPMVSIHCILTLWAVLHE